MHVNSLVIRKHFVKDIASYIKERYPEIGKRGGMNVEIANSITVPKPEHGDFSSSICFSLAKLVKNSPMKIAEEMAGKFNQGLEPEGVIQKVANASGYVNIWLNESKYGRFIIDNVLKEGNSYGKSASGRKKRMIVEFPSVNPNKPLHIGHLRNALLGDSLSNILEANSFSVEREDYIDDLGLQMAEMLWGKKHLGAAGDKKYDQFLGEQYVLINKEMQEKHAEEEVNSILKKMEEIGSNEQKEERGIAERGVKGQYETAFSYGIYHDVMVWESDIVRNQLLARAMEILAQKNITKVPKEGKYAGCVVVETKAKHTREGEESVKVLIRSNGVATYVAKDIAFHMWKLGMIESTFKYSQFMMQPNGKPVYSSSEKGQAMEFGDADMALNVIGSAQQYPQNVLKEVFETIGGKSRIVHVSYGEVSVKGGTLSGREGGWMGEERSYTADDLLRQMNNRTLEIVRGSEKIADKKNEKEIARKIALSAIKFEFLRIDPDKKVVFEWEKALDLNSNSGPYCMYMYARASRILERAGLNGKKIKPAPGDYEKITRGQDFELIKYIGQMQETIEKAGREYRPNVIAEYLMEISLLFSRFYESMPVLKGEEAKNVRLAIVMAARQAIFNMLGLLNIQTVESM